MTRLQNLMSSPIAPEWMDTFEVESLTVLGEVSDGLQDALASMAPDVRTFAGGFAKASSHLTITARTNKGTSQEQIRSPRKLPLYSPSGEC